MRALLTPANNVAINGLLGGVMRFVLMTLFILVSGHATAEVLQLNCVTKNPLADNRVYVIDMARGTASVHYDYGYTLAASRVSLEAGVFTVYFAGGGGLPEVTISRVTGKYRTQYVDGSADAGVCALLEEPEFKL